MPEPFDMFRFLEHLRRRWRIPVLAGSVAVALAMVVGLLTPNEYTATARVIIEPPQGGDLISPTAVTPIYLESLKSYELVASGDRLFADAVDHFHFPRSKPIERLKRSVLRVKIPRNTRVIEVSATLGDPGQAQALALYIAEQTVRLTRQMALDTDQDAVVDAQKRWDDARMRLDNAHSEAAQIAVDAAEARLRKARSATGYSSERLKVVDPGVVPERPSRPNVSLNVFAALLVALVASFFYLAFDFHYSAERSAAPRALAPLARVKGLND